MKPPAFDAFTLRCLTFELRDAFLGGQIQRIRQPDERTVALKVYGSRTTRWMIICSHPEWFRVSIAADQPPSPPEAPSFCMALRKHIEGGRISSIEQAGADRILSVTVTAALGTFVLVAELMGRNSNIVLLDDARRVLASARKFHPGAGRRLVLPGREYPFLPPDSRAPVWEADAVAETTRESLEHGYAGMSPFLATWLLAAPDAGEALQAVKRAARGHTSPTLYADEAGAPLAAWPLPSPWWPALVQTAVPSLAAAVETAATRRQKEACLLALRREALGLLQRERRRIESRLADLDADEARAADADEWRIAGELLSANAAAVERGATAVRLHNWYDPAGGTLEVRLDPALGPHENARAYFVKATKAKAAAARVPSARLALQKEAGALEDEARRIESADEETLRRWLDHRRKVVERGAPGQEGKTAYPPGVRIRRFDTPEGFTILVGDNAAGNDWLTTKVSDPDDIWLHVRAAASAHGVIRTGKRPDKVPPSVLRKAAELVAARSEVKASGVIPVDYTQRRYVRKPRGAPPGRVTYTREKTMFVGRDA